ncbi:hypothetical protein HLVA_21720 (plasmid) [Haliovirga abyssi]|uniref:Arm DNA-binding domain-containing protein n=1 Tax=Haliovirga abyssi TaxID=2996794 RepID=A0AAU9DAE1_9FUSO|nr:hypothetical protein HLVA_21720 [Haliovirga abyssi]
MSIQLKSNKIKGCRVLQLTIKTKYKRSDKNDENKEKHTNFIFYSYKFNNVSRNTN